ncbi:uncharacterized protein LOC122871843 [Siniperca chuatsi]|uniref:uncharacterized protein LOC122871843 n=1 Tax=Siniperca chuatsi TaxID=119488 RepID=UPI001CE210F2|nr:uncharacterized protein LOC122871843 [Siniperca chuatsi]
MYINTAVSCVHTRVFTALPFNAPLLHTWHTWHTWYLSLIKPQCVLEGVQPLQCAHLRYCIIKESSATKTNAVDRKCSTPVQTSPPPATTWTLSRGTRGLAGVATRARAPEASMTKMLPVEETAKKMLAREMIATEGIAIKMIRTDTRSATLTAIRIAMETVNTNATTALTVAAVGAVTAAAMTGTVAMIKSVSTSMAMAEGAVVGADKDEDTVRKVNTGSRHTDHQTSSETPPAIVLSL